MENEEGKYLKKNSQNFNFTARFLPKETQLTTNLIITPQKAVIHQLSEPIMAIVIENKSTIKMHQELFEVMWKSIPETQPHSNPLLD